MPLQLRGKVADSIALPASYPQVHFDFTNNYLVIPTAILNGYYAKPQNQYLKVLFSKANQSDPLPDGINTYTVYELDYVEPFNEATKYYDANDLVVDFKQSALFVADENYYDSLNPNMIVYVPNDEVTRFSFIDANVVLGFGTQPNNTIFSGITMACVNQKEDPFYAWDSTSSSKTTLSQPAANPAIINTFSFYDTADYDVTFLLTDYTFDYYSNTFPSEVLVHLTGFSAPFEFLNNTTIKVISNGHYTGQFIDGEFDPPFLIEDWDTPGSKIFIGGAYFRWAKTFVDILPIFANNVWGLESIGLNIIGAILLTGEKYFIAVAETEHSESSQTVIIDTENLNEFEINTTSQFMLPLTPIKIDFGAEVQHLWTYGRIGETENYRNLSEESDLSNTTVTLTYDSEKKRWYSPPLTSNGYPFKLQIDPFNAYNIFTNVAPQVDSVDGPLESFAQVSGIYKPAFDSDDNEFFPCMNPPNINTTYNGFLNHLYLSSIPSDLNYKVKIHQQESITANSYSDSFLNWDNLYVGLPFIRITTDFDRRLKALDDYDFPAYNYYYPADRITWLSSTDRIIISQPNALNKKNKRPYAIFSIEGAFTIYQELEAQPVATNPTVTFNDDVIEDNSETLIIAGTNFELYFFDNLVTFNLGAIGFVSAATSTQLTVTFTTQPTSLGNLTAVVTTGGTFTSGAAVQVATVVAGIVVTPNSDSRAINAPTLVIAGSGFSATANQNTVTFNLGAAGTVTSATTTQLTITFSTQPTTTGSLTAVVAVSTSNGDSGTAIEVATIVAAPTVSLNAAYFPIDDSELIISGTGFDAGTPANNLVTFNHGAVGTVTAATTTQLTVSMDTQPNQTGNFTAFVNSFGGDSNTDTVGNAIDYLISLGTVESFLSPYTIGWEVDSSGHGTQNNPFNVLASGENGDFQNEPTDDLYITLVITYEAGATLNWSGTWTDRRSAEMILQLGDRFTNVNPPPTYLTPAINIAFVEYNNVGDDDSFTGSGSSAVNLPFTVGPVGNYIAEFKLLIGRVNTGATTPSIDVNLWITY